MKVRTNRGFLSGMLLGVALSLLTGLTGMYLLIVLDIVSVSVVDTPGLQAASEWTRRNLGLSVVPFGITLALYLHSLRTLARRLDENSPPNEVGQLEHLTDVWTSLFFGIGVIWTAIGMRSALLYAIGDPGVAGRFGVRTGCVRTGCVRTGGVRTGGVRPGRGYPGGLKVGHRWASSSQASRAFWTWSRFSASSQASLASRTSSVISSPRCAGRQCRTTGFAAAPASSAALTW